MAESPPIGDHRLLSDGNSAVLLTPSAEADWWCAPRFDSPPVWWSLLDRRGASARFENAEPIAASASPAGATAWTQLQTPRGLVEVHDGLLDGRLLRLVRGLDADLDLTHCVGFGGFGSSDAVEWITTQLRAPRDQLVALSLSPESVGPADPVGSLDRLNKAARDFRERTAVHTEGADWQQRRVREAITVMTALRYEPTGAVVAAPTTSLPEAPGHDRQFDYRYTWLRDGALAASVAALHNRLDMASSYLRFVETLGERIFCAPLFTVDGADVPAEQEVDHVAGWQNSRPVRVGNAAADQVQFDALGFVVEAISTYTREGGRLHQSLWHLVQSMADRCSDEATPVENGIWEFRDERPLLSGDIGRWMALDRAIRIGKRRRPWAHRGRWRTARDAAAKSILAELRDDGRLPQVYGGDPDVMDASGLLLVMFGLLAPTDPRASRLVDAHIDALGDGPFLRRYGVEVQDEFSGVDATFTPCSWWAVTALTAVGRTREAAERCQDMCRRLPSLLSEEFDPSTNQSLGNTPLLWSHAEAARTMRVLHRAELREAQGRKALVADRISRRATAVLGATPLKLSGE